MTATADLWDEHGELLQSCETPFLQYAPTPASAARSPP